MNPWQRALKKLDGIFVSPVERMRNSVAHGGWRAPAHAELADLASAAEDVLEAVGGAGNVSFVEHIALTRARIVLHTPLMTENINLLQHGIAVMCCGPLVYHLIAGKAAASLHQALSLYIQERPQAAQQGR